MAKMTLDELVGQLRSALGDGSVRAAEPDPSAASGWKVNTWVKQGILLGFRFGEIADVSADPGKSVLLGRDLSCDVRLDGRKVSRRHLRIENRTDDRGRF